MHVSEVTAFVLAPRWGVGGSVSTGPQPLATPRLGRLLLGSENRLVAETLTRSGDRALPSVLLFWGESGVGKTQLLEACCGRFEERFGPRSTVLRGARSFAREFSRAVHTRTTRDFRERYAGMALVALDDLDELGQAAAAQQELIHLIDALQERGGTLALSADRPPERLANIDARLRSRLSAGLVAPLAAPSVAVRRLMLDYWNDGLATRRTPDDLDRIASRTRSRAPDLFSALTQESVSEAPRGETPRLSEIAQRTAQAFQLSLGDLKGPSRQRSRCDARGIAMALARELTGHSYAAIGRYFGGRDHTTVRHQCQRIDAETQRRSDLRDTFDRLRISLSASRPDLGKTCRAGDDPAALA